MMHVTADITRPALRYHGGKFRVAPYEMKDADHRELAAVLRDVRGMVMLSGYRSALYDELYGDWARFEHKAAADMGQARTECLWLNAAAQAGAIQMGLL